MISFSASYRETFFVEVTDDDELNEASTDHTHSDQKTVLAQAGIIGQLLYRTCYAASYGLTLPIYAAVNCIPKKNRFYEGLVDGHFAADRAAGEFLDRARASRRARQLTRQEQLEYEEMIEVGVGVLEPS